MTCYVEAVGRDYPREAGKAPWETLKATKKMRTDDSGGAEKTAVRPGLYGPSAPLDSARRGCFAQAAIRVQCA